MLILINQPEWFYCDSDEEHFFAWLQSIPAVKTFVGVPPRGLSLTVAAPIDRLSFYELVGLMTRYQIDKKCLLQLCADHKDAWFNDEKNYWYESVFN